VIVTANRGPYKAERLADGSIRVERSAGGLVTALGPLVQACSGTWVACGEGVAAGDSRVAGECDGVDVRCVRNRYRLRYVSLPEHEHRAYYYGFANQGLWPLCHHLHVQPTFRSGDYLAYRSANMRFAAAIVDEATCASPLLLVQDYHFALAPRELRRRLPLSTILTFWHIPFPTAGVLGHCQWAKELLDGLLGSDIAGFQTQEDCENFLDCVERMLGADISRTVGIVTYDGHSTMVRAYPVGVEWDSEVVRTTPPARECAESVRRDLGLSFGVKLGVGIDRLDYTKGINEKFLAIEHLLEGHPELRGRFTFVQVAEPSRECLPEYQRAREQMLATAERVNARFGAGAYAPILVRHMHHEPAEVYRLYRAADFCYVGSLRDGMNLVAKEFVAARADERGVLVLSEFAGAADQLRAALLIDPYSTSAAASALAQALTMSDIEQSKRMRIMRSTVAEFDAKWWAERLLSDSWSLKQARPPSSLHARSGSRVTA
jgi:trehalose 6-phosphate synthase